MTKSERWDKLASWRLLSDEQRVTLGYPATRREFADVLGVSDKTLQRDEADDEFNLLLAERSGREAVRGGMLPLATAAEALAVVAAAADGSVESLDVLVPRALARLVSMSEAGDRDATKTLLTLPNVRAWLDLQVREQTADFSATPLDELAAEVCELAGPAVLAGVLRGLGWTVTEPQESDR